MAERGVRPGREIISLNRDGHVGEEYMPGLVHGLWRSTGRSIRKKE